MKNNIMDSNEVKFCMYCGKEIENGAEVCPFCGRDLTTKKGDISYAQWRRKYTIFCLIILAICVVIQIFCNIYSQY